VSPQEARYGATFDHATIVRAALFWGADRAVSIGELAERLNLSRRQVELALNELARSGSYPIVSGPRGVYLSDSPDEIDAYADALRARLEHQAARIKGLRDCARRMRGEPKQETLPWAA
jgi:DNA-binding IscR family transcriptional regulator